MRRLPLLVATIAALTSVACGSATETGTTPTSASTTTAESGRSSPSGTARGTTAPAPGTTPAPGTSVKPGTVGRGVDGISSIVAGDGTDSGKGVPGPALSVSLRPSEDIASAPDGGVYTVDRFGNRLLLVKDGQVTIAFKGDGVKQNGFSGIAVDPQGRVVFGTDIGIHELRPDGTAVVLIDRRAAGLGTGYSMAFGPDGGLYVSSDTLRVYKIDLAAAAPTLTPFAGDGTRAGSSEAKGDGGPALAAAFTHIDDLALDRAGVLYIADASAGRVRRVAVDGTITTVAGGGTILDVGKVDVAPEGTPATKLDLGNPVGLAVDAKDRLYLADASNHLIFRLDASGGLETVIADVGPVVMQNGKPANQTRTLSPNDLAIYGSTLFYVDRQDLRSITDVDR